MIDGSGETVEYQTGMVNRPGRDPVIQLITHRNTDDMIDISRLSNQSHKVNKHTPRAGSFSTSSLCATTATSLSSFHQPDMISKESYPAISLSMIRTFFTKSHCHQVKIAHPPCSSIASQRRSGRSIHLPRKPTSFRPREPVHFHPGGLLPLNGTDLALFLPKLPD